MTCWGGGTLVGGALVWEIGGTAFEGVIVFATLLETTVALAIVVSLVRELMGGWECFPKNIHAAEPANASARMHAAKKIFDPRCRCIVCRNPIGASCCWTRRKSFSTSRMSA